MRPLQEKYPFSKSISR